MSIVGADASFSRQSGAALAGAGIRSIGRYAGPADPDKTITPAESADLISHGVSYWLVYEVDVNSWRGGYATGKLHGQQTRGWARTTLHWPDDRPIYAAYDTSANEGDKTAFMAYQQGFNDGQAVPAPGAAYADGFVLLTLRNAGLIKYTWLSDSSAFPGSQAFAKVGQPSIIQYYGRTVPGLSGIDVDECFGDDWGQHPVPTTAATQTAGGSTMSRMVAHSDADDAAITLNDDGSALVAMNCHPWVPDGKKITDKPLTFHLSAPVTEIVATFDGGGIRCRFADGHFDTAAVAHGKVS